MQLISCRIYPVTVYFRQTLTFDNPIKESYLHLSPFNLTLAVSLPLLYIIPSRLPLLYYLVPCIIL